MEMLAESVQLFCVPTTVYVADVGGVAVTLLPVLLLKSVAGDQE